MQEKRFHSVGLPDDEFGRLRAARVIDREPFYLVIRRLLDEHDSRSAPPPAPAHQDGQGRRFLGRIVHPVKSIIGKDSTEERPREEAAGVTA